MTVGKKKLVILGAGGMARELLWTAESIDAGQREWAPAGFLDDRVEEARSSLKTHGIKLPVLGTIRDYQPQPDEVFIAGIADPLAKLTCADRIASRGGRFVNVFCPTAHIAPDARIGTGCFLFVNTLVSPGARMGDHVAVNSFSGVGHDVTVEDGCTISSHVDITAGVLLKRGAFLGSHAVVLPKTVVGEFGCVGAGSVATGQVPARSTVFGVPARVLCFAPKS